MAAGNRDMKLELSCVDIGGPRFKGRLSIEGGGYSMQAGGADIWDEADHCAFAYQSHKGDFSFVARVESLGLSHPYAKAGIMARASLESGSAMVYFFVFPDNRPRNNNNGGYEFHVRESLGGTCRAGYPQGDDGVGEAPYPVRFPHAWMRVEREGSLFRCSSSRDGAAWKAYNEIAAALPESLMLGLASTAHDDSASTESRYGDVSVRGSKTSLS